MDTKNKEKLENIGNGIKSIGGTVIDVAKTAIDTGITVAEEAFKYYDKHKSTINRLALLALGSGFVLPNLFGGRSNYQQPPMIGSNGSRPTYWDEQTKTYITPRRDLNLFELGEVNRRHQSGESYRTILISMGAWW